MDKINEQAKIMFKFKDLTPSHARCLKVLEIVYQGLHHLPKNVKLNGNRSIIVVDYKSFSTFDFNNLTNLVLAAHQQCVRVELSGKSNGYIQIMLHARERQGNIYDRHPTISESIDQFNSQYK